jgi:hypothetical protein
MKTLSIEPVTDLVLINAFKEGKKKEKWKSVPRLCLYFPWKTELVLFFYVQGGF